MTETTTQKAPAAAAKPQLGRKTLRALARKKRSKRLATDRDFAKAYFGAKSKRSTDKKSAFRKKKKNKK